MALAIAGVSFAFTEAHAANISSPSGAIVLNAEVIDSVPVYSVTYNGKPVILPSKLGLELADGPDMMDGFCQTAVETSSFDETWSPVWGENKDIRNNYN